MSTARGGAAHHIEAVAGQEVDDVCVSIQGVRGRNILIALIWAV